MTPVPLLPIFALVIAVGVVAYAYSTKQISLNFSPPSEGAQSGTEESQVAQRNPGDRASRSARGTARLVVSFRTTARTATGFTGAATIANRGDAAAPRWSLAFAFPAATVRTLSGGQVVRTGRQGWVRSAAALAPGASVTVVYTARGTAAAPATCVLNKLTCAHP
ncbi:cellulose binding domain-containing protein [Actinomadura sp. PM05-2]|uniref:Cellulose binding domain-containing protein n=2 Tax=Actinomadura parmotrematis TaxID=2864039 RepID=A0ABS7G037_9ACTN|nr:cellulose binding domain-containing protein [Actinomadura parmotrematis]